MIFFRRKKQLTENVRRKKPVAPIKKPSRWLKPMFKGVAVTVGIALVGLGLLELNHKMTVTHWDVQADAHIKRQIEQYFAKKSAFDFWNTRASVIQQDLISQVPDIQGIEVSRVLPDGLVIRASARTPLALWASDAAVMLVDEQGQAYRALKRSENLDLPLLRLTKSDLKQATVLLQQLIQSKPEKALALSEVIVANQDWRLNFSHGEQWQLNHTSLETDIPKVLNILTKPRWERGYWRMDARIPQRWFIRPAKQEVI